jgi:hypothetical protein
MSAKRTTLCLSSAALAAVATLAGCGQTIAPTAAGQHPRLRVTITVTVTATKTVIRYRRRPRRRSAVTPSAAPAPSVSLGCEVLQTNRGEEFNVTTVGGGGGSYSGIIYVSFYDYAGSGDVFPGTTVNGATPVGTWHPVPAADIGASAEPTGCTASVG